MVLNMGLIVPLVRRDKEIKGQALNVNHRLQLMMVMWG